MTSSASVRSSLAFRVVGTVAIFLGGMLAAVTGPLSLSKGSWAAAYLVLVAGLAQYVMGLAAKHWRRPDTDAQTWWWFTLWNLGNLAVIGGTVAALTPLVIAGAVILVIALVLAFLATFHFEHPAHRMLMIGYRILLVLLAVSIPIGVVISALRNG